MARIALEVGLITMIILLAGAGLVACWSKEPALARQSAVADGMSSPGRNGIGRIEMDTGQGYLPDSWFLDIREFDDTSMLEVGKMSELKDVPEIKVQRDWLAILIPAMATVIPVLVLLWQVVEFGKQTRVLKDQVEHAKLLSERNALLGRIAYLKDHDVEIGQVWPNSADCRSLAEGENNDELRKLFLQLSKVMSELEGKSSQNRSL